LEGARGIEPPPGFLDQANGFAVRGAPISTFAPEIQPSKHMNQTGTLWKGMIGNKRKVIVFPAWLCAYPIQVEF